MHSNQNIFLVGKRKKTRTNARKHVVREPGEGIDGYHGNHWIDGFPASRHVFIYLLVGDPPSRDQLARLLYAQPA